MKEEYFLEMQDVDRIPISSTAIIYNTHIPPSVTPPGFTELKTVYILRNPKDVMVCVKFLNLKFTYAPLQYNA